VPFAAIPDGVCLSDQEDTLPNPLRIKGHRLFEEPDSFCKYVRDFHSEHTRLYGGPDTFNFQAVLNDSLPGKPRWGDHIAVLQLKKSPEWNEWCEIADEQLTQGELADFLDEHMEQIAEPDAGELLSDIRAIHISTNTRCDSVQREGGDISFAYTTETAAGTKTERGKIPSKLMLVIAPFRSWEHAQMQVYLTHSLTKDKELKFTIRLHRAEEILDGVYTSVRRHVEKELSLPVLV
jgi:uncharacterized protein YfdQ (DUF2303 family)